jgi:hypothetical protein
VFARWVSRRTIRRRKPAATADGASTEAPPKKRSEAKPKGSEGERDDAAAKERSLSRFFG